jgi:hypothetical protein
MQLDSKGCDLALETISNPGHLSEVTSVIHGVAGVNKMLFNSRLSREAYSFEVGFSPARKLGCLGSTGVACEPRMQPSWSKQALP